jgi:hypothetical protein
VGRARRTRAQVPGCRRGALRYPVGERSAVSLCINFRPHDGVHHEIDLGRTPMRGSAPGEVHRPESRAVDGVNAEVRTRGMRKMRDGAGAGGLRRRRFGRSTAAASAASFSPSQRRLFQAGPKSPPRLSTDLGLRSPPRAGMLWLRTAVGMSWRR